MLSRVVSIFPVLLKTIQTISSFFLPIEGRTDSLASGGVCNEIKKVTFGLNRFSSCLVKEKFLSCKHRREFLEKALDSLLQGNHIAPYSLYKAPYENPVPVLRNYLNTSESERENGSRCLVPVGQTVAIQYTSVSKGKKQLVFRVVGMKVDRTLINVTDSSSLRISTQISFFLVPSSEQKSESRYWEKVYSGENSENAWFNIFKAFENFSPSEESEAKFWFITWFFCICVGFMCTKLNLHFG